MRPMTPHVHDEDPSMIELARVEPNESERVLLVVFPRTPCSASASGVFVDERGRFLGAVAPGSAALLSVPVAARSITLFSSVEVTAPLGTWHDAKRVTVPVAPSGLILHATQWGPRECASGQYFEARAATKRELEAELAESDVDWLSPSRHEGQAWLDSHRRRVAEVLRTRAAPGTYLAPR
jgi:hypothetical protein